MDLFLIFIAGIFTALGPCVMTVLPIVFAYTFGISESKTEAFIISLSFVLGFSIVFSLLGAVSSIFGIMIGFSKIKYLAGIIAILFGITILLKKRFSFRSKQNIFVKIIKKLNEKTSFKYKILTSIILGISYGFGANVCADPVLAGILTYTASKEDILFGFFALLIYSLGYGLPIILLSTLGMEGKKIIEKISNFEIINIISGLMLIILGVYLLIH
ncbi:cytochrome c biogenesis protein transmembrane region [Methanococcus aeolicus Nankai-3]|uniref:Cytochrome c biogenesis protein transmembrane region n=1 Tax=Methanococcus aeolicus (strain ATCC BAA-1280 / DSM 17508 / OCM 812 / Nankai-3) TaxID=419665 RepID=A6UUK1_META3|nr:cytochrome c biogenesis CcdA family protein [Methanococcus aeolicus]ABR56173.1 cytochrome c biogenesis protein transmembrane region [Methanococcus aeolicus Nankai-3]